MDPPEKTSQEAAELRHLAEARWRERNSEAPFPRSEEETLRLLHQLEVHQIELEMQNEELEQARQETAAALKKLTDLYDFAPVAYLTLDRTGVILEANLCCAALFGVERATLVGKSFTAFVAEEKRTAFEEFSSLVFSTRSRKRCELPLALEGRATLEVELEAAAAENGHECRVALMDLTERHRLAEDRLIRSKLESTGVLASGIAHDFNNLLMSVVLNLDLAAELADGDGELVQCLEGAKQTALKGRSLTNQLLTFSKGGTLFCRLTALPKLIGESARAVLGASHVDWKISHSPDVWPVMIDEGQFAQVLRNLLLNASEAMPDGGVVTIAAENLVRESTESPSLPAGNYVRVSVIDQGVGIEPANLPRIFDPYFSTKRRGDQKGVGLGLTICHAIVQKHGGALTVRSAPGEGSTFDVYLRAGPTGGDEEIAGSHHRDLPLHRILVMDDEEGVRNVCGNALRKMGQEVVLVETGEGAIAAVMKAHQQGARFDVALLDLTIRNGLGGKETLLALRKLDPQITAVVMSGYADDPVVADFKRFGFDGALIKPFGVDSLRSILARVVARAPT
jgi:two-component system, cell cycle sensor histidine kinase and response regulator CckA